MKCPNCGTDNPSNANFCFNCAHNLKDTKNLDSNSRLTKYVPPALMDKIRNAGGIQNERRIVSILFCDLVGSSSRAETMDPEEWTDIANGAFDYIIPPVYNYEGFIARMMGDGILAFFGAPISHEDDPERAILAGLEILAAIKEYSTFIQEKWGFEINVRIGINTGLVVVGEMGSDLRVEYTAMGDAINVASRMETSATPGTIQVTQGTFKHVSYMFDAKTNGQVSVKGKAEPITTFEILRKKPSIERHSKMSYLANFVEREKELNHLRQLIEKVEDGSSQICWISGEAGLGKSRLILELRNNLDLEGKLRDNSGNSADDKKFYWFETGSLPYQISTPYGPIINFFLTFFNIRIDMTVEVKNEKLSTLLRNLPNGNHCLPFIANLLQIPVKNKDLFNVDVLDPAALQEETIRAITLFLSDYSKISPLILVFDDIQWADQSSKNLLNHLLNFIADHRVALIILSREKPIHGEDELYSRIFEMFEDNFSQLELENLSNLGASNLIANLLKVENLSDEIRSMIISKGQGNPFYVEELVKSFIDSGYFVNESGSWVLKSDITDLEVPETLTNLLMTRLDQLDEKTRRVAQSASVIGREFMIPILQCLSSYVDVLEDSLNELENREWIIEKTLGDDRGYIFKHVLSRDVAYNSLLFKRRKELHKQVADCLLRTDPNLFGDIGRHLFESDSFQEAIPFIIKAAENAIRNNSILEAISLLTQAENIQNKLDDFQNVISLYMALGSAYALDGKTETSAKYFETLYEMSKKTENQKGEVKALNKLAEHALYSKGDAELANDYLTKAEVIGTGIKFAEGIMETSALRCVMHQSLGEFDKSAEYEEKGMEASASMKDDSFTISFKFNLIVSKVLSLHFDEGLELVEDFLQIYELQGEKYYSSSVYGYVLPVIRFYRGEITEAIESCEKGLKLAFEIDARYPIYLSYRTLGDIYQFQEDHSRAIEYFEQSVEYTSKTTNLTFLASSMLSVALLKRIGGQDSPKEVQDALELLETPNGKYWASKIYGDLGYYFLEKNELEEAGKYFDIALSVISASYLLYKPYNLIGKTQLMLKQNYPESAAKTLEELERLCTEHELMLYYPDIEYYKAAIAILENDNNTAKKHLEKAIELAGSLKMNFVIERMKKLLP